VDVFAVTLDEETAHLGRRALQRLSQDAGLKARRDDEQFWKMRMLLLVVDDDVAVGFAFFVGALA
jgi:hypothetical protein